MCVQYPHSSALETLRLASARPVSGGKSRRKVRPVPGLPPAASTLPVRYGTAALRREAVHDRPRVRPAPTAPVPLSSRAAASLYPRTPRTRPGPGGLARRQRSRSCTTSAKQLLLRSAPQACTSSPIPVGRSQCPRTDSAAQPRRGPREPQRPHSELRHALHTARMRRPETHTPYLRRPCLRAAPYPNIAPKRMGRDWPMADQSAVRRTADAQRGNAPQPPRAVRGGRQHPSRADREGHTGGREVRRGLAW